MDLDRLIDAWRGALVGLLLAWGNDRQRALELAQDTFAEAYLGRERFRGAWNDPGSVGPWLRGIALHLHLGQRRRERGPRASVPLDGEPAAAATQASAEHPLASPMQQALASLRAPWRAVLTMRYLEGSRLGEIAALLGISERAVEGRLRRARTELKQAMARAGHLLEEPNR